MRTDKVLKRTQCLNNKENYNEIINQTSERNDESDTLGKWVKINTMKTDHTRYNNEKLSHNSCSVSHNNEKLS